MDNPEGGVGFERREPLMSGDSEIQQVVMEAASVSTIEAA